MPRKVVERGQQANQARDAAMAAAGMEAEETTALDFYLDRLKTDIAESPGRVLDVATNFVAAVPGLLGDAQRVFNPKTGAPEGVRKLPTSSDIAEDMGASGEGYGAILGQLLSPLSPADFKLALGAGGALLGYMGVAGQGRKLPRALEAMRGGPAYHGTPHKFDQFDLEKIGTGEGAQAYGHGLYFAEDASVAGHYQNKLSDGPAIITLNGERKFVSDMPLTSEGDALYAYERAEGDIAAARKLVFSDARRWLDANADDLKFLGRDKGHLYEVDIPDETIDKMLDWDAPLSEQPENVKIAMRQIIEDLRAEAADPVSTAAGRQIDAKMQLLERDTINFEGATGEDLYRELTNTFGGEDVTSEVLAADYGIPGIRYLDGSSRNVVGATADGPVSRLAEKLHRENGGDIEKTLDSLMEKYPAFDRDALKKALPDTLNRKRNIVVFNPDDIKSVKRDGELVYEAAKPTTSGVDNALGGGRNPFRNQQMRKWYDTMNDAAHDPRSELFNGPEGRNRGGSHRVHFWRGFDNAAKPTKGERNTNAYASWRAGRDFAESGEAEKIMEESLSYRTHKPK